MRILFIAITLISINAFASFDCTSTDIQGYRITTVSRIGAASTLKVQFNGTTIYNKVVVESREQNRQTYISPGFTNKRNAPASLFLNIYQHGNQILGQFSETSYLPVVPYLQLKCK